MEKEHLTANNLKVIGIMGKYQYKQMLPVTKDLVASGTPSDILCWAKAHSSEIEGYVNFLSKVDHTIKSPGVTHLIIKKLNKPI